MVFDDRKGTTIRFQKEIAMNLRIRRVRSRKMVRKGRGKRG